MTETPPTPTLADLLGRLRARLEYDLRVSIPGRVVAYDATSQTADVQPLLQDARIGTDGVRVAFDVPVLKGVPVAFPGAGDFAVTFPLAAGDGVLLVFADRALVRWFEGAGSSPVDPGDDRAHDLSDAVAIPGLRTRSGAVPVTGVSAGALVASGDRIYLGGSDVIEAPGALNDGVVTGKGIDSFTGTPYSLLGSASTKVFAK